MENKDYETFNFINKGFRCLLKVFPKCRSANHCEIPSSKRSLSKGFNEINSMGVEFDVMDERKRISYLSGYIYIYIHTRTHGESRKAMLSKSDELITKEIVINSSLLAYFVFLFRPYCFIPFHYLLYIYIYIYIYMCVCGGYVQSFTFG